MYEYWSVGLHFSSVYCQAERNPPKCCSVKGFAAANRLYIIFFELILEGARVGEAASKDDTQSTYQKEELCKISATKLRSVECIEIIYI